MKYIFVFVAFWLSFSFNAVCQTSCTRPLYTYNDSLWGDRGIFFEYTSLIEHFRGGYSSRVVDLWEGKPKRSDELCLYGNMNYLKFVSMSALIRKNMIEYVSIGYDLDFCIENKVYKKIKSGKIYFNIDSINIKESLPDSASFYSYTDYSAINGEGYGQYYFYNEMFESKHLENYLYLNLVDRIRYFNYLVCNYDSISDELYTIIMLDLESLIYEVGAQALYCDDYNNRGLSYSKDFAMKWLKSIQMQEDYELKSK